MDKIANNPMPYCNTLVDGTSKATRDRTKGRILIDLERKAKQIMIIIKDFGSAMVNTDKLMEKANSIITRIKDNNKPETIKVKAISKFLNGGMLLQLNSKEAARWLQEPDIEDKFLKKLAKDAYVKERSCKIVTAGLEATADSWFPDVEARLMVLSARRRASLCLASLVLR